MVVRDVNGLSWFSVVVHGVNGLSWFSRVVLGMNGLLWCPEVAHSVNGLLWCPEAAHSVNGLLLFPMVVHGVNGLLWFLGLLAIQTTEAVLRINATNKYYAYIQQHSNIFKEQISFILCVQHSLTPDKWVDVTDRW